MNKTKIYHPAIIEAAKYSELVDIITNSEIDFPDSDIIKNAVSYYTVKHFDDIMLVVINKDGVSISFRGTVTGREWVNNFDGFIDNEGFHDGWNDTFKMFKPDIDEIVKKCGIDFKYFTSGHSRGGALAIMVAYYLADFYKLTVNNVTFGAPLVMDAVRRDHFRELPINSTRCEIWRDPVPKIPPKAIGYKCESFVYALNNRPWYFLPLPGIGIRCHLDYFENVRMHS